MNQRGQAGNMILFVIFFFMMLLIAGGIVAGTLMFFGPGYDGRQLDSDLLNQKVRACIEYNSLFEIENDIFSVCGLNKVILEGQGYKINVCEGGCGNDPGVVSVGSNFDACKLTGKNEGYPKCTITTIYKDGRNYEVLTGSSQVPRRISE